MELFKKSWKIGHFKGVEIHLHVSMLLIVPFIFYLFRPENQIDWLLDLILMTGLLVCVLSHEIGHAVAAQFFGIAVNKIVLWPLGGITHMSRVPQKPIHKLVIGAAGPFISIILALIWGTLWWSSRFSLFSLGSSLDYFWANLIYRTLLSLAILNGVLVIFNLLPIYPLDGGGMFNALMEMVFGKSMANTISVVVGIPFLFGLIVLGVFTHDFILLIFCVMLALGIGTLNPQTSRWINLGINYVFKRTGYHHLNEDYEEAIRGHTKELEKNHKDISHLLGRAIAYLNVTEKDLALKDIEAVLKLDPNHLIALEMRGEMHSLIKEYDSALAYFVRAKSIKPEWPIPYFDCGSMYLEQKQFESALSELNRAIELHSQHPIFFLVRSIAHYSLQDLDSAHRDQAEAIRLSPRLALAMSDLNLSIYDGYLDWAKDYYGWVLEKYPKQWLAYQGRADAYAVNSRPDSAIVDYDHALGLAPQEVTLYLRRGLAYQKMGYAQQASDDFRKVLAITHKTHLRTRAEKLLAETTLTI